MAASALDVHRPLRPAPSSCLHSLPPLIPFPLLRALKIKTIREIRRKKRRARANSNDAAIWRRASGGKRCVNAHSSHYIYLMYVYHSQWTAQGHIRRAKASAAPLLFLPSSTPPPSDLGRGRIRFALDARALFASLTRPAGFLAAGRRRLLDPCLINPLPLLPPPTHRATPLAA